MARTIVVTGGAGYIGCHLVRQLIDRGDEVRVIDGGLFGFDGLPASEQVTLYPGTILNLATLLHAFDGADAVVHLAGLVGDAACNLDPTISRAINVGGTRFVHTMVNYAKIPRLVFASSCSVYGATDDLCVEDGPLNPVSLYAETKAQSERELLEDADLPVTILRLSTVYGHSARPRFDLVGNLFTAQAVQDGKLTVKGAGAWRPFVHAEDVANAIVRVLISGDVVHRRVYNVGGDEQNLTIGGLAQVVREIVEPDYHPVEIETVETPDDLRNYRVSFDRIRTELGWTPSRSIPSGISEMAHYASIAPEVGGYGDYRAIRYHNHLVENIFKRPVEAVA